MGMSDDAHRICRLDELDDPGSREFRVGDGDWPFMGFLVRREGRIFAYRNYCMHVGHPLNWKPDDFLTRDRQHIICASHGAMYAIDRGVCVAGPCVGRRLYLLEVAIREEEIYVRCPSVSP
jgi:nitrite reductase/ring-hydroxylating ferredoxin subunit